MSTPYYFDEHVTLYHGDCRDATAWLDADVLVTDPPYGMSLSSGMKGHHGNLHITGDDDLAARDEALNAWVQDHSRAAVFARWTIPPMSGAVARLTWDKGEHVGMGNLTLPWKPNTEDVYIYGTGWHHTRRSGSVLRYRAIAGTAHAAHKGRNHPTEKPIDLMEHLVLRSPSGIIADPFAGSGSTLIAARNLGRFAIGVEIEERYCEIAAKRLAQGVLEVSDASA